MTITIYHQHHYHHNYHHGLCHHSFHPAMNHPPLRALCPFFLGLCDFVQTYSIIVPADAVWQPDQLHFDDARACLALQLQLMASTSEGKQWGLWSFKALRHRQFLYFHSAYPMQNSQCPQLWIRMVCCFPLQLMILSSVEVRILFSRCLYPSC